MAAIASPAPGWHSTSSRWVPIDFSPGRWAAAKAVEPASPHWVDRTHDGKLDADRCDWCRGPLPPGKIHEINGLCSLACARLSAGLTVDPGPVANDHRVCNYCGIPKHVNDMARTKGRTGLYYAISTCKSCKRSRNVVLSREAKARRALAGALTPERSEGGGSVNC